jgi:outer-membrane receptor for ferric coprogen and ferric-rhodotorulic acid
MPHKSKLRFVVGPVFAGCAGALILSAALPQIARAQSAPSQVRFNIEAGSLDATLTRFASQSGYQLVYSSAMVEGKASGGVKGTMSVQEALARVLAGSGLAFRMLEGRTIQIDPISVTGGERVLGAVRVEGAAGGSPYFGGAGQAAGVNGVNGSRDITATEGTGSFTSGALTIGSKVPQAMKDIPQSLSVLTSERLEQQSITDFTSAMRQLPGVKLDQGGTNLTTNFYSRGFAITSIQVDGGPPRTLTGGPNGDFGYLPQIDMSQYDHVELLRGAAGTFNGYGDPSGTINLVRKRPLDHQQLLVELQAGSWNNYRATIDGTGALTADGKLRTRFVYTFQDNQYFYEVARDNRKSFFGVTEYDLTPSTLLSAGFSLIRQKSTPFAGGLMLYANGKDPNFPRSRCFCFPWNRQNISTDEIFGSLEQRIGKSWTTKFTITQNIQSNYGKGIAISGGISPLTEQGPVMTGGVGSSRAKQISLEGFIAGGFNIFGQRQEISIGINRSYNNGNGGMTYDGILQKDYQPFAGGVIYCYQYRRDPCPAGATIVPPPGFPVNDWSNFNPGRYLDISNPLAASRNNINEVVTTTGYFNARFTAFNFIHLTTGLRWSRYASRFEGVDLCRSIPASGTPDATNCVGRAIGDAYNLRRSQYSDSDVSWPPTAALSFDISKSLTAYGGYADIYESQQTLLDGDLNPLPPITGYNLEAGLKWAPNNALNVALSAYYIKKSGYGVSDFARGDYSRVVLDENGDFYIDEQGNYYIRTNSGKLIPNGKPDQDHECCYTVDNSILSHVSRGVDLDVTGEIARGFQVSFNIAYNNNKDEGSLYGYLQRPILSLSPKLLYKAWLTYDFGANGRGDWLNGFVVSLGANGQSSGYKSGSICVNLLPNPAFAGQCTSYAAPDFINYAYTVKPYVVFSGRLAYKFNNNLSLSVNLENILDKTYYQSVGSVYGGNWYGAPRSFTASLRARF